MYYVNRITGAMILRYQKPLLQATQSVYTEATRRWEGLILSATVVIAEMESSVCLVLVLVLLASNCKYTGAQNSSGTEPSEI